jgi:hypothetical protein
MANRNHRPTPPMMPGAQIAGALICKSFELPTYAPDECRQSGDRARARVGRYLPSDVLLRMKNRRALEDAGYIKLTAIQPGGGTDSSAQLAAALGRLAELEKQIAQGGGFRFAVHTGMGRYDVIEGQRLNAAPLTKEEASALCEGRAPPAAGK